MPFEVRAHAQLPATVPLLSKWQRLEKTWEQGNRFGTISTLLSNDELESLFDLWGTPSEGRAYVRKARLGPSRKVGSKASNVVTKYTSRKMQCRIFTESRKPEYRAALRYDFDGATRAFYCQPPMICLLARRVKKRKDGRTTDYRAPERYTPDILKITKGGIFVEEWKTEDELARLAVQRPDKIFKDDTDNTWRYPEREQFFADIGITFCLRSSDENSAVLSSNLEFLDDWVFGRGSEEPLTDSAWAAISAITSERCPISLEALSAFALEDKREWGDDTLVEAPAGQFFVDDIFKAIVEHRLFVDLEYDDLSEAHTVIVCASPAQLETVRFTRPAPKATSDLFTFSVDIGTRFMFRNRPEVFEISMVNDSVVHYTERASLASSFMSVEAFEGHIYRRDLTLVSSRQSTEAILRCIEAVDDEQVRVAKSRFQMFEDLEHGRKPALQLCPRQIQRLRKQLCEAGDSPVQQLRALLPKTRTGGRAQITEEQLALIRRAVEEGNNPSNPSGQRGYTRYKTFSAEASVPIATPKTFYNYIRLYKDLKKREGSRIAYAQSPAAWYLNLDDKVHGGRPFHRVHIDHTQLDCYVKIRSRSGRYCRVRPWLTVIMDAETRAVLAFYLALHAPSTVSCMMAFRAMVERYKRCPAIIVVDNGADFRSYAFDRLCDRLLITLQYRPAHEGRFGAVMERLFGKTNQELIHSLVGNSKALQHVRTVTKSTNPIRQDLMEFSQLHGLLDYYFFHTYNTSPHPAHGEAPIVYMDMRIAATGRRLSRVTPYDDQLYILTCLPPSGRGSTRKLDKARGVKIGHVWYWAPEFADKEVRPQTLDVLIDIWDVSICYVKLGPNWVRAESKMLSQFRRLTKTEMKYIMYETRMRIKGVRDSDMESMIAEVLREHNLPVAVDLTEATRRIYGAAGLVENPSTPHNSDADQPRSSDTNVDDRESTESTSSRSQTVYRTPSRVVRPTGLTLNFHALPITKPLPQETP